MLGRKQRENNDRFIHTWNHIETIISKDEVDNKIDATLESMKRVLTPRTKYGSAWSGGKDSVVVDFLCRRLDRDWETIDSI